MKQREMLLLLLFFCYASITTVKAEVIWREDFENKEKVAAEWRENKLFARKTVPAPGIIALDQSRRVNGKQSARINPDVLKKNGPGYRETVISSDLPPNQGGVLSAWFFDYGESYVYYSGVDVLVGSKSKSVEKLTLMVTTTKPTILFRETGLTPSWGVKSNILRRYGWRKLQFVLDKKKSNGKVRMYVDGRFLGESNREYDDFKSVSLGAVHGQLRFWPLFFDAITLDDDPKSIEKDLFRGLDLTLSSQRKGNVFNYGEDLNIKVQVENYGDKARKVIVEGKIFDDQNNFVVASEALETQVASDSIGDFSMKIPAPGRKGPMFLKVEAKVNGEVVAYSEMGVGVIENPKLTNKGKNEFINSQFYRNAMIPEFINVGFMMNRFGGICDKAHTWASMEPKKDEFNWKNSDHDIDELLNKYGYSDIMFTLHSTPNWAADPVRRNKFPKKAWNRWHTPPVNMDDWREFVSKIVTRYRDKVKYWEIWNEVNTAHFEGNTKEYFQILKTAYEAIKKADPKAKVIGITCSHVDLSFYEKVFELGGLKYIDILGIHPYPHGRPEKQVLKEIIALRKLMAKYGETKPIWDTEFGFYTAGLGENGRPKTRKDVVGGKALGLIHYDKISSGLDVANWTARLAALYKANGFERIFYHGGHPMLHANGMAKFGVYSLAAASKELSNAKFVRKIDFKDDNLHAYLFKKNNELFAVLWAVDGQENVCLTAVSPEYQVIDIWGNATKKQSRNQSAELLLTESPIYLKGVSENLSAGSKKFAIEIPAPAIEANFSINVITRNSEKTPLSGKVILQAPNEWRVEPESIAIEVPAKGNANARFSVTAPPGVLKGEWSFKAEFQDANGKTRLLDDAKIPTLIPIPCAKLNNPMTIDGNLKDWPDDWTNAPTINDKKQVKIGKQPVDHVILDSALAAGERFWDGEDDLSAKFQCAWDKDFLYLAIKVRDDQIRNQHPNKPYSGDCLEIFIDPRGREARADKDNPGKLIQLFFAPKVNGESKARMWTYSKSLIDLESISPETCDAKEISKDFGKIEYASKIVKDGYLAEIKIPFSLFECGKPKPGASIGFDLAVDDQDLPNKKRESQLFWVGDKDNHKNPSRFGVIELR